MATSAGAEPSPPVDAIALAQLPGVGSARFRVLLARFGTPADALRAHPPAAADRARRAADAIVARLRRAGGSAHVVGASGYPVALLDLPDPPPLLYAVGRLELLGRPTVAIVGTREAAPYARRVARHLAGAAARAGAVVLSGLARGIDGEAHEGAIAADGDTVAVLGTGPDVAYPRAHLALHRAIAERGLLLSELPFGDRADAGSFPRRNRLIAALADVTVVVQAGHRSGALITAAHALELGRAVAAVPGPIDEGGFAGSNLLLRDGAHVIADAADLLQLLGVTPAGRPPAPELEGDEAALWDALAAGPVDVDTLATRSRLPTRACLAALSALELAGLVECGLTGEVARRA